MSRLSLHRFAISLESRTILVFFCAFLTAATVTTYCLSESKVNSLQGPKETTTILHGIPLERQKSNYLLSSNFEAALEELRSRSGADPEDYQRLFLKWATADLDKAILALNSLYDTNRIEELNDSITRNAIEGVFAALSEPQEDLSYILRQLGNAKLEAVAVGCYFRNRLSEIIQHGPLPIGIIESELIEEVDSQFGIDLQDEFRRNLAEVDPMLALQLATSLEDGAARNRLCKMAVRNLVSQDLEAGINACIELGAKNLDAATIEYVSRMISVENMPKGLQFLHRIASNSQEFSRYISSLAKQMPWRIGTLVNSLGDYSLTPEAIESVLASASGCNLPGVLELLKPLEEKLRDDAINRILANTWGLDGSENATDVLKFSLETRELLSSAILRRVLSAVSWENKETALRAIDRALPEDKPNLIETFWANLARQNPAAVRKESDDNPGILSRKVMLELSAQWDIATMGSFLEWHTTLPAKVRSEVATTYLETAPLATSNQRDTVVAVFAQLSTLDSVAARESLPIVIDRMIAQDNPASVAQWTTTLPALRNEGAAYFFSQWASTDPVSLSSWLRSEQPGLNRDLGIYSLVTHMLGDEATASLWVEEIQDSELREIANEALE